MKRVLLTGGGGAIGVHVIAHLMHNTDWEVVVLDSFRHKGYKDRIREVCTDHPDWPERIKILQHDLVCPISQELQQAIGPVNHILHLAALSDVFFSVENPVYVIKNNIESTLTMLEYAKNAEHESFVYFSTDEVYGPTQLEWRECEDPNCPDDAKPLGQRDHKHQYMAAHAEWDTHRPSNAYSASKAASEDICYPYWRSGEVKLIITNTMNNFGEMQAPSKYPAMLQQQLDRGEKVTVHGSSDEIGSRFYIHSRNTADALLYILNNLPPKLHVQGEIDDPDRYHIVGDERLDNLELAQRISNLMGVELDYELKDFHHDNPAHDIHYGLQDNKLRAAGWKQPMTFDASMQETIKWQKEHPEWLR